MLVATRAMLAMRCPECGLLEYHGVSRFDFPPGKPVQIRCSCGGLKAVVTKKGREYLFSVRCLVCEQMHASAFDGRLFRVPEAAVLTCPSTGLELGCAGFPGRVRPSCAQQGGGFLSGPLAGGDYFRNAGIMNRILDHFLGLAGGSLLFCQCGNYNIVIEVFPERLEVRCPRCGAVSVVFGETEEDAAVALKIREMELAESGITLLEAGKKKVRKH